MKIWVGNTVEFHVTVDDEEQNSEGNEVGILTISTLNKQVLLHARLDSVERMLPMSHSRYYYQVSISKY